MLATASREGHPLNTRLDGAAGRPKCIQLGSQKCHPRPDKLISRFGVGSTWRMCVKWPKVRLYDRVSLPSDQQTHKHTRKHICATRSAHSPGPARYLERYRSVGGGGRQKSRQLTANKQIKKSRQSDGRRCRPLFSRADDVAGPSRPRRAPFLLFLVSLVVVVLALSVRRSLDGAQELENRKSSPGHRRERRSLGGRDGRDSPRPPVRPAPARFLDDDCRQCA
jgi:hypothetical protein